MAVQAFITLQASLTMDIDTSIYKRLVDVEDVFLRALGAGSDDAIAEFEQVWLKLQDDIRQAKKSDSLSNETSELAFLTASRVSIVADAFLDMHVKSTALTDNLHSDLDNIMARVSLQEIGSGVDTSVGVSFNKSLPLSMAEAEGTLPPYIEPSYRWLLNNLHHPYPSKECKTSLLKQTGCSSKDIDGWFVDVRKRIGWNALRKSRFSNKRIDIVDAATRFFHKADSKRPLDPAVELEFVAIESRARELYSERFFQSPLATKLDAAVQDMTLDMKARAKAEQKQRKQLERRRKEKRIRDALSYPSPERSPGASPLPLSRSSSQQSIRDVSPASRRRRSLSSVDPSDDDEPSEARSNKRIRLEPLTPSHTSGAASLPSPAASLYESIEDFHVVPLSSTSASPSTVPVTTRKRRLSNADEQQARKRSCNTRVAPSVQAASNPFPMSIAPLSFDQWYQSTFTRGQTVACDMPPAVSVEAPDETAPLDIEIYNFSSSDHRAVSRSELLSPALLDRVSPSASTAITLDDVAIESFYNNEDSLAWFDLNHCGLVELIPPSQDVLSLNPIDEASLACGKQIWSDHSASIPLPILDANSTNFFLHSSLSHSDNFFQHHSDLELTP